MVSRGHVRLTSSLADKDRSARQGSLRARQGSPCPTRITLPDKNHSARQGSLCPTSITPCPTRITPCPTSITLPDKGHSLPDKHHSARQGSLPARQESLNRVYRTPRCFGVFVSRWRDAAGSAHRACGGARVSGARAARSRWRLRRAALPSRREESGTESDDWSRTDADSGSRTEVRCPLIDHRPSVIDHRTPCSSSPYSSSPRPATRTCAAC